MKSLRPFLTSGLMCAMLAIAFAQPAMAVGEEKPAAAPAAEPEGKPSATLDLASDEVRLIMGGTAGKGVLHFKGKDYPFTFKTASAGLGMKVVTSVSAVGDVYNLAKVEDFADEYTVIGQVTLAGEAEKHATYKSTKGVVVKIRAAVKGAGVTFGGGVATIKLGEKEKKEK